MSTLPTTRSFTPLATIPLPNAYILHPAACNPTMDLVALILETRGDSDGDFKDNDEGDEQQNQAPMWPPSSSSRSHMADKRKEHNAALIPDTEIVLWRLSGSKVWQVNVPGCIIGMAWSRDGIILSLLTFDIDRRREVHSPDNYILAVRHLSVHTGGFLKSFPLPAPVTRSLTYDTVERILYQSGNRREWWRLDWVSGAPEWPKTKPGSALMIMDSLPGVTPIVPPTSVIPNPSLLNIVTALTAKAKTEMNAIHGKLATFPTVLQASAPRLPDILVYDTPARSRGSGGLGRLLTGTFPLVADTSEPVATDESTLILSQMSYRLARLFDVILYGFETLSALFRQSDKQTLIWREELETCGTQQGMSKEEVHSDLFRLLMTSRSGPAVSEWIGNRMTERTIARWELTLGQTYMTIKTFIAQSIFPAIERIVLILEELSAWGNSELIKSDLILDRQAISRALALCRGCALLVEKIRQDAELEAGASAEWVKWLRYEMARSAARSDGHTEAVPKATHDLKLVWSFMKTSFVSSVFHQYFPSLPIQRYDDLLPPHIPPQTQPVSTDLNETILSTISRLSKRPGGRSEEDDRLHTSPSVHPADLSFSPPRPSNTVRQPPSPERPPESPDTAGEAAPEATANDVDVDRNIALEPWIWANSIAAVCEEIVRSAQPRIPTLDEAKKQQHSTGGKNDVWVQIPSDCFLDERLIGQSRWIVSRKDATILHVLLHDISTNEVKGIQLVLGGENETVEFTQAAFFDDLELAVVFQLGNQRYLGTTLLSSITDHLQQIVAPSTSITAINPVNLALNRCRLLGPANSLLRPSGVERWSLALNGRQGRRVGCVLMRDGNELEVLDMDEEDEDEDEGEGELVDDIEMS